MRVAASFEFGSAAHVYMRRRLRDCELAALVRVSDLFGLKKRHSQDSSHLATLYNFFGPLLWPLLLLVLVGVDAAIALTAGAPGGSARQASVGLAGGLRARRGGRGAAALSQPSASGGRVAFASRQLRQSSLPTVWGGVHQTPQRPSRTGRASGGGAHEGGGRGGWRAAAAGGCTIQPRYPTLPTGLDCGLRRVGPASITPCALGRCPLQSPPHLWPAPRP